MGQIIIESGNGYEELNAWIGNHKVLLVCNTSIRFHERLNAKLRQYDMVRFSDFQPNPLSESVVKGLKVFQEEGCDAIIAVGGGSAIDVAKCIKLYGIKDEGNRYKIPFMAIPTTAGSGAEATRYAVIYDKGEKQSIMDELCIPDVVLMDSSLLNTLPLYQKKSTMMDAFCHAVESFWSINSTEESRKYSRNAITAIVSNMEGYLNNSLEGNAAMLQASYTAGKAINITQTTAGHAMCYKITSLFGISHGHAAILCVRVLFPWMINHIDKCIDLRGEGYLSMVFCQIAEAMGCRTPEEAAGKVDEIFDGLELAVPAAAERQIQELRLSVNPVRLKNHPICLDEKTIDFLYRTILRSMQ